MCHGLALAGESFHVDQQIAQRVVGRICHLGEGAQKAIGAWQLKERFFAAVSSRCGADYHDIVEGL